MCRPEEASSRGYDMHIQGGPSISLKAPVDTSMTVDNNQSWISVREPPEKTGHLFTGLSKDRDCPGVQYNVYKNDY